MKRNLKTNWKMMTVLALALVIVLGIFLAAQAEWNTGEVYTVTESVRVEEGEFKSSYAMKTDYLNKVFRVGSGKLGGGSAGSSAPFSQATSAPPSRRYSAARVLRNTKPPLPSVREWKNSAEIRFR